MINQKEIIEEIADLLTLPAADIDPEAHLQDDLGLNPVEIADLLTNLAHKFNIVFDRSEATQIKSVGDIIELIEDKSLE